jgi:membrane protein required for colicin V production
MGTWNWLDWILATVIFASVATAVLKGFIRELISLVSVVTGLIIAALGYRLAAVWFEDLMRAHEIALGAAFLALFLGTLALGALVSLLARKFIKTVHLEWFDRFLGGVFGLARGLAVDSVLLLAMVAFGMKTQAIGGSALAPYVATGARIVVLALPGEMKTQFHAGFERFKQALIENDKRTLKN